VDFDLSEGQATILAGLDQLLASVEREPPKAPVFTAYSVELDRLLAQAGYLDIVREDPSALLEGAMIVERLARLARSVEAAASILVGAALGVEAERRPIALASALEAPARFLPMARTLIVAQGEDALIVDVEPSLVEPLETLFAYPYGRLRDPPAAPTRRVAGAGDLLRRRWRLALAAEAAGLMQSALDTVLDHVKTRLAFGRPLGAFQSIQHRLTMGAETVQSTRWLALRAAWSDSEVDVATAAAFAQDRIPALTYDLHQFCGAMGLTLEFPLHHWTYRLRALLGELGGSSGQARAAARAAWAA